MGSEDLEIETIFIKFSYIGKQWQVEEKLENTSDLHCRTFHHQ